MTELIPYLFIVLGIILLLFALLKKTKTTELKHTGEKAEGIVFDLDRDSNSNRDLNFCRTVMNKVTVRFVTKNQEWITGEIKQDFSSFFTGQYKEGDKLDVYYDPQKPSDFIVITKQSEFISRLLFAAVGLILCLTGLYKLFLAS